MSIIRQRSKNLITAGTIGFILAIILVLLVYVFGIRGNEIVIEWLLKDSQLEVMTMSESPESEVINKIKIYSVIDKVEKGDLITRAKVQSIEVIESLVPKTACSDIDQLLDKKAIVQIDPLTIITQSMFMEASVFEMTYETTEIRDLRIPEILKVDDYINLRIHFPTGQDYTVICDKRVKHIDIEQGSLFVDLTEEEILKYSSAKEDKNLYFGTELYMTKQSEKIVEVTNTLIDLTGRTNLDEIYRYDEYPVNPNAQILSRIYNYDLDLLQARVDLDESLLEFFDQDDIRYSYILKEKSLVTTEVVLEDGLQPMNQTSDADALINSQQSNAANATTNQLQANDADAATNSQQSNAANAATSQLQANDADATTNSEQESDMIDEDNDETNEEETVDFDF